jgi:predicted secreted Zn-dependent protease
MISFDFKQLFAVQPQKPRVGVRVSHLWISSVILMILVATFTLVVRLQSTASATPVTTKNSPVAKADPSVTETTKPTAVTPSVATSSATTIKPADCLPAVASAQPTAINLSGAVNGLTQLIEAPRYYQIFGDTPVQIHDQLRSCAPHTSDGEAFAGETDYTLTWQYKTTATGNGLCTLDDIKIGLHVTMDLPSWAPTSQAMESLSTKWGVFISSLIHHENGHAALDAQYAAQLLSELQNHPATDCAALSIAVQAKASNVLANLNAANSTYDAHTNHGATQGAILP